MIGMDAATGKPLTGNAHLAQSIGDILSTPIGTRVGRRDYGSNIAALIDSPMNPLGRLRLFAATADAIRRWEPRIRLTRVGLNAVAGTAGAFTVELQGQRTDDAVAGATTLSIPLNFV